MKLTNTFETFTPPQQFEVLNMLHGDILKTISMHQSNLEMTQGQIDVLQDRLSAVKALMDQIKQFSS